MYANSVKHFLASSFDKTATRFKELNPTLGNKVLFVENAAEPWKRTMELFWVENDRKAFTELGFEVAVVDLHVETPESLSTKLDTADVLHVCGGGVFYINELIKDKNLVEPIVKAVAEGKVVYTGTSAGSIIVSKTFGCYEPETEEVPFVKRSEDKVGLGLVDFVVVPHNNNPDSAAHHATMVPRMVDNPEAYYFIRDNQALWVEDGRATLVTA